MLLRRITKHVTDFNYTYVIASVALQSHWIGIEFERLPRQFY